jgi:hypothetical protein
MIGGVPGRPDSKFYDKVYLNGYGGLIPSSKYLAYAGKEMPRLLDSESNDLLSESWLEDGVEIVKTAYLEGVNSNIYIGEANLEQVIHLIGKKILFLDNGTTWVERIIVNVVYWTDELNIQVQLSATVTRDNGYALLPIKQPHLLTYKSSTTTDIIGNPANYPTDWLSHLASGKSIVGNALLVGQDGTDYTTGATDPVMSKKVNLNFKGNLFNIANQVWSDWNTSIDTINNTATSISGSYIGLYNRVSSNQSALQSTPQKVLQVQHKAIASNSHSVYKGAMMTYAGTGKIAVGNGSNGLESRVVEDSVVGAYDGKIYADGATSNVIIVGKRYLIVGGDYDGEIWTRQYQDYTGTIASDINFALFSEEAGAVPVFWSDRGFSLIPTHNPISLDNSDSPATKWFTTLAEMEDGELAVQTFSEEGKYNASGYGWNTGTGLTFEQLTNGTKDGVYEDDLQTKTLTKRLGVWA